MTPGSRTLTPAEGPWTLHPVPAAPVGSRGTPALAPIDAEVGHGGQGREAWSACDPDRARPCRAGGTLLLADDEPVLLRLTTLSLEREGYTVLAAPNGRTALAIAEAHPGRIDLLLTDMIMPEMGGLELWKALCARRPETRVLFMSGGDADDMPRDHPPGAPVRFIAKPFELRQLYESVRDIIRKPGPDVEAAGAFPGAVAG